VKLASPQRHHRYAATASTIDIIIIVQYSSVLFCRYTVRHVCAVRSAFLAIAIRFLF